MLQIGLQMALVYDRETPFLPPCLSYLYMILLMKPMFCTLEIREKSKTSFNFKFYGVTLDIVNQYKYLGTVFTEHLDFEITSSILTGASGRSLG